jgi:hypothetical protein
LVYRHGELPVRQLGMPPIQAFFDNGLQVAETDLIVLPQSFDLEI